MQLMLKVLIVCSVLLVYLGLGGEELIAKFYSEHGKYNREEVSHAYENASSGDTQDLVKAQKLDLDSREFYSRVNHQAKRLLCVGSLVFFICVGLIERRCVRRMLDELKAAKKAPQS